MEIIMSLNLKKIILVVLLVISLIILFSCMSQIAEIKKNPEIYNGKDVSVSGTIDQIKILNSDHNYYEVKPLYLYLLKDNFDQIAVISTDSVYIQQYKRVHGKVLIFKYSFYENEIRFIISEIADYLIENNALPSSKQKESQKLFISLIAAIINILTGGKLEEPVNSISDGEQKIIDSSLDDIDKKYIEEITESLLKFLPKDEIYYLILED